MKVEFDLPERTVDPTKNLGLTWFTISFHSCLKLWSKVLTLFNIVKGKKLLIPSLLCLFCIATSLHPLMKHWWMLSCFIQLFKISASKETNICNILKFTSILVPFPAFFVPFIFNDFQISSFVTGHSHLSASVTPKQGQSAKQMLNWDKLRLAPIVKSFS